MNLDMWFKDDIRNIIVGVELAAKSRMGSADDEINRAFQEGFDAAIVAIAASFGLISTGTPSPKDLPGPRTVRGSQTVFHTPRS